MDYLLIISAALAFVMVVLVVRQATIESKRIDDEMAAINSDFEIFKKTKDDTTGNWRYTK